MFIVVPVRLSVIRHFPMFNVMGNISLIDHFSCNPKALVHLTACSKSCVATVAFPFTILAVKDGIYNLYRANLTNETGKNKFGQLLCENMSISDVMRYIENQK